MHFHQMTDIATTDVVKLTTVVDLSLIIISIKLLYANNSVDFQSNHTFSLYVICYISLDFL